MPQPVREKDRDYRFEDSDGSLIHRKEKIVETVGIPDDIRNVGRLVLYQDSPQRLGYESPGTSSLERQRKSRSPFRSSPPPPVKESEKDYSYRDSDGTLRRRKERVTERVGIPDDVVGLGKLVLSRESSQQQKQVSTMNISAGRMKTPSSPLSPQRTPPPTMRKNFTYRESDGSIQPRRDPFTSRSGSNRDYPNGVAAARKKPPSRDSSDERHVAKMEIPRSKTAPSSSSPAHPSPGSAATTTYTTLKESRESHVLRQRENFTQRAGISNEAIPLSKMAAPSSRESSEERHKSSLYHPVSPGKPKGITKSADHKVSWSSWCAGGTVIAY